VQRESLQGVELSMKALSEADRTDLVAACQALASTYRNWIKDREAELSSDFSLSGELRETSEEHLRKCRECHRRIEDGIARLDDDAEVREAFQGMNYIMLPDTIVATNLHADILSDLAAALAGSLGIAPTANINPERDAPSMFEPIHGSAFDIAGKGIANPAATFWTAAMMLEHLGEKLAAERLMTAVERVTADPLLHTPDLGGKATTKQVTDAVCEALRQAND
jgi:hypothetical protein